ncbi:MAG: TlpA family protein disulfide reductase [Nitrosotalea sp.]
MKTITKSTSKYVAAGVSAAVIIIAIVFFAVDNSSPQKSELTTAPESTMAEELQVNNTAPDFSLTDPQKGQVTKQTFAGKPLFIFFTASYCTPCQIGAQNLAKYYDETGKSFNVLIVFVDDSETNSQFIDWKNKFGRDEWYIAKGTDMARTYHVQYLDTKYVFDKNGVIRWMDVKPLDYSSIDPVMKPLRGV